MNIPCSACVSTALCPADNAPFRDVHTPERRRYRLRRTLAANQSQQETAP
jgi:hypothetical protein